MKQIAQLKTVPSYFKIENESEIFTGDLSSCTRELPQQSSPIDRLPFAGRAEGNKRQYTKYLPPLSDNRPSLIQIRTETQQSKYENASPVAPVVWA